MFWHLRFEWYPQQYIVHKIVLFVFEGLYIVQCTSIDHPHNSHLSLQIFGLYRPPIEMLRLQNMAADDVITPFHMVVYQAPRFVSLFFFLLYILNYKPRKREHS